MEQYILKSAVEVEIERRYIISREKTRSCRESSLNMLTRYWEGKADAYRHVMDFLDSTEVKKTEEVSSWSEESGQLCLDAIGLLRDYASGVKKDSPLGKKICRAEAFLSDLYHKAFYSKK